PRPAETGRPADLSFPPPTSVQSTHPSAACRRPVLRTGEAAPAVLRKEPIPCPPSSCPARAPASPTAAPATPATPLETPTAGRIATDPAGRLLLRTVAL